MHISDGVLPLTVTIGGYVASAGLATWSVRRTSSEDLPKGTKGAKGGRSCRTFKAF
jgi:ABC-type Co2+ transport system permease subunit